ncbi:hypothetical protein ABG768_010230, partial [Culter alburnus]
DELPLVTNSRGLSAVATCHMLPCTSPTVTSSHPSSWASRPRSDNRSLRRACDCIASGLVLA